jgi:hypothetical protein
MLCVVSKVTKDMPSFTHLCVLFIQPTPQDEAISDALVAGLEIAARTNHATRTCEPLIAALQHGPGLNETETYGCLRAILHNTSCGLATRDTLLLEFMRHVTRHGQHVLYTNMVQAFGISYVLADPGMA